MKANCKVLFFPFRAVFSHFSQGAAAVVLRLLGPRMMAHPYKYVGFIFSTDLEVLHRTCHGLEVLRILRDQLTSARSQAVTHR